MEDLTSHLINVARYSVIIGIELNLNKKHIMELATAAQFHDIGKIKINKDILYKPNKLTEVEFEIMKRHPIYSVELVKNRNFNENIINGILHHHERWDGEGYNIKLNRESISYLARIISVADTYDAITSQRCYSNSKSHEFAVKEILDNSGIQFDPNIVNAFKDSVSNRFKDFNLNLFENEYILSYR